MFEQLCDELPWTQRLSEVWRMRNPEERDTVAGVAVRARQPAAHRDRLVPHPRTACTPATRRDGHRRARRATSPTATTGKDSLLICDTWEIADALNRRLHDTLTTDGPTAAGRARSGVRVGDLIVSRRNDATIDVRPGARHRLRRPRRSGPQRQPLARRRRRRRDQSHCRRTSHRPRPRRLRQRLPARARHPGLRRHRALRPRRHHRHRPRRPRRRRHPRHGLRRHVPRPRHQPGLHLHPLDQKPTTTTLTVAGDELHHLRRGTKYSAAHHLRIIAGQRRPAPHHARRSRTDRPRTAPRLIGRLLDRHDQRLIARAKPGVSTPPRPATSAPPTNAWL